MLFVVVHGLPSPLRWNLVKHRYEDMHFVKIKRFFVKKFVTLKLNANYVKSFRHSGLGGQTRLL